jgi:hypothetical protein
LHQGATKRNRKLNFAPNERSCNILNELQP